MYAMGEAYARLLDDREMLLGQMQMYAACSDSDVCNEARAWFAALFRYVEGWSPERARGRSAILRPRACS